MKKMMSPAGETASKLKSPGSVFTASTRSVYAFRTANVVRARGKDFRDVIRTSVAPLAERPPAVPSYATTGTPKRPWRKPEAKTWPPSRSSFSTTVPPASATVA
jgi:hypothetical protein